MEKFVVSFFLFRFKSSSTSNSPSDQFIKIEGGGAFALFFEVYFIIYYFVSHLSSSLVFLSDESNEQIVSYFYHHELQLVCELVPPPFVIPMLYKSVSRIPSLPFLIIEVVNGIAFILLVLSSPGLSNYAPEVTHGTFDCYSLCVCVLLLVLLLYDTHFLGIDSNY